MTAARASEPVPSAELTPREREAYARGRRCFEQDQVEPALQAFSELLRTRGGFADVHYMVGLLHERRGELEAAERSLRQAIHLNPDYAEALLALASIYERQGDFDRSRALAERATRVSRGTSGALDATTRGKLANLQAAVGDAYAQVGELREAIEAYRKALDRCPDFHDIRHRLAVALREAGLPHQAERELQRVLRAHPGLLESRVQLGVTYYTLGRAPDAMSQWRDVLRRDPSRRDARMYLRLVGAKDEAQASQS